jgi:hypothetical protein
MPSNTNSNSNTAASTPPNGSVAGVGGGATGGSSLQTIQNMTKNPFVSVHDVLSHKLTMFNFRLPNDRNMYEASLIYCNVCEFSCDLSDKSAIICHFVSKHPQDNIVYSYLWPQMELNQLTQHFKIKYYLIKAHLKIRSKDAQLTQPKPIEFPNTLLNSEDREDAICDDTENDFNTKYVLDKMLDWLEKSDQQQQQQLLQPATVAATAATAQDASDVQELEEEQEVQEVEMTGEDLYDAGAILAASGGGAGDNANLAELVKLTSSALFYTNQQKLTSTPAIASSSSSSAAQQAAAGAAGGGASTINPLPPTVSLQLDNNYLVHLLAINKSENVFRVKQIHDYYGGCFICGKQVEFNMKHYQV